VERGIPLASSGERPGEPHEERQRGGEDARAVQQPGRASSSVSIRFDVVGENVAGKLSHRRALCKFG
jgi:hypothetical protein